MSYVCFACGQHIFDVALYQCDGRHFHKACLKCQMCALGVQPELGDDKLYAIDGLLVCRKDYTAMRSACRVCQQCIGPHEFRVAVGGNARNSIHTKCMSCQSCRASLERGDKYVITQDNRLLCHKCCHQFAHFQPSGQTAPPPPANGGRRGRKRATNNS